MDRHPHRNVITIAFLVLVVIPRIGADFGILEEHLVEITHAVKQQRILLVSDLQILQSSVSATLHFAICCQLHLVHLSVLSSATM